jgi:hypothetical protein
MVNNLYYYMELNIQKFDVPGIDTLPCGHYDKWCNSAGEREI